MAAEISLQAMADQNVDGTAHYAPSTLKMILLKGLFAGLLQAHSRMVHYQRKKLQE
jgi:hypothetical protein